MKHFYIKTLTWYQALPWYWKILGVAVLALLALLWILSLVEPKKPDTPPKPVDAVIKPLDEMDDKLEDSIELKKKDIARRISMAAGVDEKTVERKEKIEKATTMAELDALQKEWGL